MEIKTIEIAGFAAAFTALRLPYGRDVRSTIETKDEEINVDGHKGVICSSGVMFNPEDIHLAQTLVKNGDEHAKAIRGVVAYAEITAPIYWWCELETYRAGRERLSSESTMHIDCKGLSGVELVKAKSEMPMGKELKKVDMFSYQCLRNIVRQRKSHRLPEWHQFIEWVKTLPFAEELIFAGL